MLDLAPGTVRNHQISLEAYTRWWRAVRPDCELATTTSGDLAAFLVSEADRGLSARTRRAEIAALRRLFGWLLLTGAIEATPAAALATPRTAAPHTEVYTAAEVRAILQHTATLEDLRGLSGTRSSAPCASLACGPESCACCAPPRWTCAVDKSP